MKRLKEFVERFVKNSVTFGIVRNTDVVHLAMVNVFLSRCHSCDAFSVWIENALVFPVTQSTITPHDDMPADVKADFIEAASIVDKSPRGAAALLRLAVQKLMLHLGQDARDINTAIGNLVRNGLDERVQKSLDVVRVIGNNAVHPGEIDMTDGRDVAMTLFSLVNIIVQSTVSTKKQIDAMYQALPAGALAGIAKRDSK